MAFYPDAIFASTQVAVHGADRLISANSPVYAMCRPPGHHAYPDLMTGVCYFNNAAIAAQQLTKRFGKVAMSISMCIIAMAVNSSSGNRRT